MAKVLVVDDELSMREFLQILLEGEGHQVETAGDLAEAVTLCQRDTPDLVYTDLKLPGSSGMDLLRYLREEYPETQVIMMTAFGTADTAVEAMRLGAYDYQVKPVKVDEIRALTAKALEKLNLIRDNKNLSAQLRGRFGFSRFIGTSPKMTLVVELIEKVARSRTNVLIEGESGTGKELVARSIHEGSSRAQGPFVAINCGAIPETLIEAELFGHVAGAFTGAGRGRRGLFEAAHGGTIFLDEIGELPQQMQVRLLRVVQERTVRRVGDEREKPVDARIVAATNRDLQEQVKLGRFREDLFYRLNVVRIRVPPLRERIEDIPPLATAFAERFSRDLGVLVNGITHDAMQALTTYRFPGNVRELENYIERAITLATGESITVEDLPEEVRSSAGKPMADLLAFPASGINIEATLEAIERRFIDQALKRSGGVKTKAARLLGLSFRSFRYRLAKLEGEKPTPERRAAGEADDAIQL